MSFIKELIISIFIITFVAILSSQLIIVPTESMSPAINPGDVVLVEKINILDVFNELDPNDVQEGDIIVYQNNQDESDQSESDEMIIHRIKAVKTSHGKKYLILKGDNNKVPDQKRVYLSQVEARAILWDGNPIVIPKLGFLIYYIKDLIQMV